MTTRKLTKGTPVRFGDENDKPQIGTVLEYSDACDGTGKYVYWIEAGGDIYARGKEEVEPPIGPGPGGSSIDAQYQP